ncbi:MAG: chloride channel protein [Candidatus Eremiobacteraeota bacterium]|nr:chloride channel protein [Candidatus Eremiobacteraeota bacterium]
MHKLRDFSSDSRLILMSGLALGLGILSTLAARLLLWLIALCTGLFFQAASPQQNHYGAWVILVPAVGAGLVGLMARFGSEKIRGHGIPEAIESILLRGSRLDPRVAWLKPLSAAISIGSGGPFGAEGPIIMTGGSVGSVLAQFGNLTSNERKTLLVSGAAAGMAAVFNSPLSATLLGVELLLFEMRPASLVPVALAAGTATLCRRLWLGDAAPFAMESQHPSLGPAGLLGCLLCALLAALCVALLTHALYAVEDGFRRLPLHWAWWPALGGLVVGVGGYFFPPCLGVGYDVIQRLLGENPGAWLIVGVLFWKTLVWLVALGSGTSGGILAPVLMIGAALGCLEAAILPAMGTGFWPLLSMGAVLSSCLSAPLTALVFCLEVTRDYPAALGLLIATCAAHGLSSLWLDRSIMTEKVARRGYHISREYAVDPLEFVLAREAMQAQCYRCHTLEEARPGENDQLIPLLDEHNRLHGVVRRSDWQRWRDGGVRPAIVREPITVGPQEPLRRVERLMAESGLTTLPVVGNNGFLGLISLRDLLKARANVLAAEGRRQIFLRLPAR